MVNRLNLTPGPSDFFDITDGNDGLLYPHWSINFKDLYRKLSSSVSEMVGARDNPTLFLTASGTGTLESLITNVCNVGDQVIIISNGFFGDRLHRMAEGLGLNPIVLDFEWDQSVNEEVAITRLKEIFVEKDIKAVLMVHLETSTGIINSIRHIGKMVREAGILFLVDAISSFGTHEIDMFNWGIDGLALVSYKGLQSPPGLGIAILSTQYTSAMSGCKRPIYSLSLKKALDKYYQNTTMTTAPTNAMILLEKRIKSLKLLGFRNHYELCKNQAEVVRELLTKLGFELFGTSEKSNCISTIVLPSSLNNFDLVQKLETDCVIYAGRGLGKLENKVARFAHFGILNKDQMNYLERGLRKILEQHN